MISLEGRVAIISGGANGIGRATSRLFAKLGATVVVADIDQQAGLALSLSAVDAGTLIYHSTDTASEASIQSLVAETVDRLGRIDILVNGAPRFIMRGVRATVEEWRDTLEVNVLGYALMAREVASVMQSGGGGSIVNIASISALIAQDEHLTYSTSKAAILGFTRCLAKELAPAGIRVNAVSPGTVWTDRTENYIRRRYNLGRTEADGHPEIGGLHMLRRTADPDEIARPIAFLASDAASFVTGTNLVVDGGYIAQ